MEEDLSSEDREDCGWEWGLGWVHGWFVLERYLEKGEIQDTFMYSMRPIKWSRAFCGGFAFNKPKAFPPRC